MVKASYSNDLTPPHPRKAKRIALVLSLLLLFAAVIGVGVQMSTIPISSAAGETAFAVYSADDKSLNFYKRTGVPSVGDQFEGKTVTAVYEGVENTNFGYNNAAWKDNRANIVTVEAVDSGIKPISTAYWFYEFSKVQSITLSKLDIGNVTNMDHMFAFCSSLSSINVSGWNTSNVTNMADMFFGCSKLASLNVSGWNTSNVTDTYGMFSGCSKLVSLNVSGWNTSNVTDTYGMFSGCYSLSSLDVSKWDTSNVKRIGNMFSSCSSLSHLDVSGWNTSNVTIMHQMFYNCSSLSSLDVSGWSTSNVTDMRNMFVDCSSLSSLDVSGWNTSNVTDMNSMFYNCSSLSHLDVSGWNTSNVTNMYSMFHNCSALSSLDVSSWDTSNVTNMGDMFRNCQSLINLNISSFDIRKVTDTSQMFDSCMYLETIYVGNHWNTSQVLDSSNMFFNCRKLIGDKGTRVYPAGAETTSQPLDKSYARIDAGTEAPGYLTLKRSSVFAVYSVDDCSLNFYNRSNIPKAGGNFLGKTVSGVWQDIELSDYTAPSELPPWNIYKNDITNVKVVDEGIKPISTAYWFNSMPNIASIDISKLDTDNTINMRGMFDGCSSISEIDLRNMNTALVTDMARMFAECSSLERIYVAEKWFTERVTNSSDMFVGCFALGGSKGSRVYLEGETTTTNPLDKTRALIDGGEDFPGYLSQKPSQIFAVYNFSSKTLKFYNRSDVPAEGDMLEGASVDAIWSGFETREYTYRSTPPWHNYRDNITNVKVVDEGIKPVSTSYWFYDLRYLKSLDIGKLDTSDSTNMNSMFSGCSSLESFDASGLNTNNVIDMTSMFANCSSLESLDISGLNTSNVEKMGTMFVNCSSLKSLDVGGFNTANVTNMSNMFLYCSSLTHIDGIEAFDTRNVTSMWGMFSSCTSLTNLNLNKWSAGKVTNTKEMFCHCSNLVTLDLSNFNSGKTNTMYRMFEGCSQLTKLDISGFDTRRVTNMSRMFHGCLSLTVLDLTAFDTIKVESASGMFAGCSSLVTIYATRAFDCSKVAAASAPTDKPFYGCHNLVGGMGTTISFSTEMTMMKVDDGEVSPGLLTEKTFDSNIYAAFYEESPTIFHMVISGGKPASNYCGYPLSDYYMNIETYSPSSSSDVPWNGKYASQTLDVTIVGRVCNIRDTSYWFSNFTKLSTANLFTLETAVLQKAVNMFVGCSSLTNLRMQTEYPKLVSARNMFKGCTKLPSLAFAGAAESLTDVSNMFMDCANLKTLNFSNWRTGVLVDMTNTFAGCENLIKLDVSGFKVADNTSMDNVFGRLYALEQITLSDQWAFNGTKSVISDYTASPHYESSFQKLDENGAEIVSSEKTPVQLASSWSEMDSTDKNATWRRKMKIVSDDPIGDMGNNSGHAIIQYYAYFKQPCPHVVGTVASPLNMIDSSGADMPINKYIVPPRRDLTSPTKKTSLRELPLREDGSVYYDLTLTKMYEDLSLESNDTQIPMADLDIFACEKTNSYITTEIWVLKEGRNTLSTQSSDFDIYAYNENMILIYDPEANGTQVDSNRISYSDSSLIRLVSTPVVSDTVFASDFYDYDITDGCIYSSPTSTKKIQTTLQGKYPTVYVKTDAYGINSYAFKGKYPFAFGNANTGTRFGAIQISEYGGSRYNSGNRPKGGSNDPGTFRLCNFGLVENTLGKDGLPSYKYGITTPPLFTSQPVPGKSIYDKGEYSLGFSQYGNVYTLTHVTGTKTKDLDKFTQASGSYQNGFWPMDAAPSWGADGHDLIFGDVSKTSNRLRVDKGQLPKSDDDKDHNPYFGMKTAVEFDVTAGYCGPLDYYFFGDDDMYVYLDGKLIVDLGGVHLSAGFYVNMWDYIKKSSETTTHRLDIFYLERGASGSVCWMQLAVPTARSATDLRELEFNKIDNENSPVAGAEFTLYSDEQCTKAITKAVSDEKGVVKMNWDGKGIYYMKETSVPENFLANSKTYKVDATYSVIKLSEHNPPLLGDTESSGALITDVGDNAYNKYSIVNVKDRNAPMPLPITGSGGQIIAVIFMGIGLVCIGYGMMFKRRRQHLSVSSPSHDTDDILMGKPPD